MIKYEIEYYNNIKKQVKILERIAESLKTIADEQERKRREHNSNNWYSSIWNKTHIISRNKWAYIW